MAITGVTIQETANATLQVSAVHTWDSTGATIHKTANATLQFSVVKAITGATIQ